MSHVRNVIIFLISLYILITSKDHADVLQNNGREDIKHWTTHWVNQNHHLQYLTFEPKQPAITEINRIQTPIDASSVENCAHTPYTGAPATWVRN